ncbi:MAG: class IV adenylate cyclase [Melioribacteraceae bacterium]|jgi:adenylate cyclase class IV|nr:class IV adenylate cyclase [Melioribacteraceae bacterium]
MPVNLEIKLPIKSINTIENKLSLLGAQSKGVLNQKDFYFKIKKGLLKLRKNNESYELIKYNRDEKGTRWSDYKILTITGKAPQDYLKTFLNFEILVEKRRILYVYKNTRIHLDKVKKLGQFLELETLLTKNKRTAIRQFNHVIKVLNLDTTKQIRASYRDLLLKKNDNKQ